MLGKRDIKTINPYFLAVPVLAIGLQDSASATVSPAIASICAAFPQMSIATVQLMVTLPSLASCIIALFYGYFSSKVNPRKLVILGLSLFILGGISPVFMSSFYTILVSRVILGLGAGLTLPASTAIIPLLYEGQQRENMMGYNVCCGAAGCMLMLFSGGHLAAIGWRYCFLGYCIGIISLLLVVFMLPQIPMPEKPADSGKKVNVFKYVHPLAYVEIAAYFIACTFMTMVTSNVSLFVEGEKLGTAANSGTSLTLHLLGAAIGAVFYGLLKKKLKYYIIPVSWAIVGIGFLLVSKSTNISAVYLLMILAGIGVGAIWPAYCMRMTELSHPAATATILAIAGAIQGFATFINPEVNSLLISLFGFSYGRESILACGIILSVGALTVTLIHNVFFRNGKDIIIYPNSTTAE